MRFQRVRCVLRIPSTIPFTQVAENRINLFRMILALTALSRLLAAIKLQFRLFQWVLNVALNEENKYILHSNCIIQDHISPEIVFSCAWTGRWLKTAGVVFFSLWKAIEVDRLEKRRRFSHNSTKNRRHSSIVENHQDSPWIAN